jgi:hypothetical protein
MTLVIVVVTSIGSIAVLFPVAWMTGKPRSFAIEARNAAVPRKSPLV